MLKTQNNLKYLLVIILLGLALRYSGITHSFPYIFHPDEPTIVRSAQGIRFNPNPKHFDWPHLYIYLNFFAYSAFVIARKLTVELGVNSYLPPVIYDDALIFYLITRIFTATLAALTAVPVYLTSRKFFGEKAGLLSALLLSVLPFHVLHSHYSLPDAPMVFMLAWAVYFGSEILISGSLPSYIKTGLCVGLSASIKYHGGLAALLVPIAHIIRVIKHKEKLFTLNALVNLVLSGVSAAIGFFIGTPFALLDYKTFSRTDGPAGAFWQFTNVGSVSIADHFNQFAQIFSQKVIDDVGYTPLIAYVFTLLILIYKLVRKKVTEVDYYLIYLFIPSLFFLYYIAGFDKDRSHYYMIFYPFLAIVFGFFVTLLFDIFEKKFTMMSFAILCLALFPPFYYSIINSYTFYNGDTRTLLGKFVKTNIPQSSVVFINTSTVQPVVEKNGNKFYKGANNFSKFREGYLILAGDSYGFENDSRFFYNFANAKVFKEVLYIDNVYMLGPKVKVYQYSL